MNKIRIGIWLESNPKIGGGFQYDLTVVSAIKFLVDNYPDEYQMFCYTDKEEWIEEIHRNFGGEINSVLAPIYWFERILLFFTLEQTFGRCLKQVSTISGSNS